MNIANPTTLEELDAATAAMIGLWYTTGQTSLASQDAMAFFRDRAVKSGDVNIAFICTREHLWWNRTRRDARRSSMDPFVIALEEFEIAEEEA